MVVGHLSVVFSSTGDGDFVEAIILSLPNDEHSFATGKLFAAARFLLEKES